MLIKYLDAVSHGAVSDMFDEGENEATEGSSDDSFDPSADTFGADENL